MLLRKNFRSATRKLRFVTFRFVKGTFCHVKDWKSYGRYDVSFRFPERLRPVPFRVSGMLHTPVPFRKSHVSLGKEFTSSLLYTKKGHVP